MSFNTGVTVPYSGGAILNPYGPSGGAVGTRVSFQFWGAPVLQKSNGEYYCPGFDGPTYASNPWDFIYLGIPSTQPYTPGLAKVDIRRWRDVDKKKAAGNDGARVTIHGVDAASVEIELKIWTPEQLRQLANIWPILFPQAYKGPPPAYDVQHPKFSIFGVKSVQFVAGSGPDIQSDRSAIFKMSAVEFLRPNNKNVTATAVGAIGSLLDEGATIPPLPGSNSANTGP